MNEEKVIDSYIEKLKETYQCNFVTIHLLKNRVNYTFPEFETVIKLIAFFENQNVAYRKQIEDVEPDYFKEKK